MVLNAEANTTTTSTETPLKFELHPEHMSMAIAQVFFRIVFKSYL